MRDAGRSGGRIEEAELFYADLLGLPRQSRARTVGQTAPAAPRRTALTPPVGLSSAHGRLFDEVVHRGGGPFVHVGGPGGEAWQVLALPGSIVPELAGDTRDVALVHRGLGEGRLALVRPYDTSGAGASRQARAGERLPADTLLLRRVDGARAAHDGGRIMPFEADGEPDASESVPRSGRGTFRHDPLGGAPGDNVEVRFNVDAATAAGTTIDVVVHLHGFGTPSASFLATKAARAGLDMVDAAGAVTRRAGRPTLALVPRGTHRGGERWTFEGVLPNAAALFALVDAGLAWLAGTVLGLGASAGLPRGRLTMMAHSGGGAGLSHLLGHGLDPDEVVCLDSMYGGETSIIRWATTRIASPRAAASGLRAFYTGCSAPSPDAPAGRWVARAGGAGWDYQPPGSWRYWPSDQRWHLITTEISARRLQHAIDGALAGLGGGASTGASLASRFKVERTSIAHDNIPLRYAPALLDDITAALPSASVPPPASARPSCVVNADWLTSTRKLGGDDPPPPRPTAAAGEMAEARQAPSLSRPLAAGAPHASTQIVTESGPRWVTAEDVYAGPRVFTPSADPSLFHTAPAPVAVTGASEWPTATTDPDSAARRALATAGATPAAVTAYAGAGLDALRPIAAFFGEPALVELLARLRYTPGALAAPPHSYASMSTLGTAFGRTVARPVLLAIRLLLAVPGHFRQLARRADSDTEAYALETLGWLLMGSLRDEVQSASGLRFWLPDPPSFAAAFPNPIPALGSQLTRLVVRRGLVDDTLRIADFNARLGAWRAGPAGRTWLLETGRTTAAGGRGAGAPFYPEIFTIPPSINVAVQRGQVRTAWASRLAAFDAGTSTVPLGHCDDSFIAPLRLFGPISLRGLQLRTEFPSPASRSTLRSLTGLTAVAPAFEAAFQAIADLGWNDLLFETQGLGCFRGTHIPGNAAAARRMSEHSLGLAVDLNVFENAQNTTGSMDPRLVALFEAHRFAWGRGFPTPDAMHFEYRG